MATGPLNLFTLLLPLGLMACNGDKGDGGTDLSLIHI